MNARKWLPTIVDSIDQSQVITQNDSINLKMNEVISLKDFTEMDSRKSKKTQNTKTKSNLKSNLSGSKH